MAKAHKKLQILNTFKELTRKEQVATAIEIMKCVFPPSESEIKQFDDAFEAFEKELDADAPPWDEPAPESEPKAGNDEEPNSERCSRLHPH